MSDDAKQAWDDVGKRFVSLGSTMREHYKGAAAGTDPADASAVKAALERLKAAVAEAAERTGDLVRDESIRSQTKDVAGSLERALSATVDQISQAVEGLVHRKGKGDPETDHRPEADPPEPGQ
jgi:hypothetical protein